MDRQPNINGMKIWNKKINMTSSIKSSDWQQASGHSRSDAVHIMPANINKVEDLTFSQENKLQKQSTMENCMTD